MNMQLLYAVGFLFAYLLVIASMELLHRQFKVKAENTRKIAHTLATISSVLFLVAFNSYWYVFGLAVVFFLIFWFGRKYKILLSLESVGRKTAGTYILPVSVFIIFWLSGWLGHEIYFVLPILIVGICDPLAGYMGSSYGQISSRIRIGNYRPDKTLLGTGTFFVSALIVSAGVLAAFQTGVAQVFFLSVVIAVVATLVELVSERGLDNITVPLAVVLILHLLW